MRCTGSFREVKDSGVYLCVDCSIDDFRRIVGVVCLLANLPDYAVERIEFGLYLPLDLLHAQAFSVYDYKARALFVEAYVVFGPVDKRVFVVCLGDGLFAFVASLAIGEHPGEGVVDCASEGQGEPFFAFGDGDGPVHGLLF